MASLAGHRVPVQVVIVSCLDHSFRVERLRGKVGLSIHPMYTLAPRMILPKMVVLQPNLFVRPNYGLLAAP